MTDLRVKLLGHGVRAGAAPGLAAGVHCLRGRGVAGGEGGSGSRAGVRGG